MDVEISVPSAPVALTAGEERRVRVGVANLSGTPLSVRLAVARGRAAAWSLVEPATVELAAGGHAEPELVFRPPEEAATASALQPFTVQAQEVRSGAVAGRGTGLLTLDVARRLTASLTAEAGAALRLAVTNHGHTPVTLVLDAVVDPASAVARVEPPVLDLPRGTTAYAQVTVRPPGVRSRGRYAVTVSARDATADGAETLLTVHEAVTLGRRASSPPGGGSSSPAGDGRAGGGWAWTAVLVVVLLALGGAVWWRLGPSRTTADAPSKPAASPGIVRPPYALVDVFPRQDGPNGLGAAQAALARLTQSGVPVRLVDSTTTEHVADTGGGLWVLLQDGFASVEEARQYCLRHRAVAPKCNAVP